MSPRVVCPYCGESFYAETRAKVGSGTQRRLKSKVNKNQLEILKVFFEGGESERLTVRQVQGILYNNKIPRWRRGDRSQATGGWNYHQVQADLSLLVGNGLLNMSSYEEGFDDSGFNAKPVPTYYMNTPKLRGLYERLVWYGGDIKRVIRDLGEWRD